MSSICDSLCCVGKIRSGSNDEDDVARDSDVHLMMHVSEKSNGEGVSKDGSDVGMDNDNKQEQEDHEYPRTWSPPMMTTRGKIVL